jgi:polysaccharide export outer membrane protein
MGSRFILILLSGYLFGQMQSPAQTSRGLPAATVAASPAQPLEPSGINVWKEPDFSRSIQVRSDGKMSLPLLGEVQAAGRTPLQLEQDISTKLQYYIAKPKVTVMVEKINSKNFNILGQVVKPGSYSLALAPTIVDAIAIAAGPRDFAKQKSIYILRQNSGGGQSRIAFNYKAFLKGKTQNIKLEPHDTVVVP